MSLLILQRILLQLVFDILIFPVWWYTAGVRHAGKALWHWFQDANSMLAPGLWLQNIFVPMFGQHDLQGRIMSVFMRIMNVLFRSIGLVIWSFILLLLFCLWFVFPVVIIMMFLFSLSAFA